MSEPRTFRDADPVAWTFHRNTSRWPHNAGGADPASTAPDPGKEYPGAPLVALPEPTFPTVGLAEALHGRLSCRVFGPQGLSLAELSTLLAAGYGMGSHQLLDRTEMLERPVPSGGGLYPLELYVLARAADGLEPGIYHYVPLVHGLEQLVAVPAPPDVVSYLFLGQPYAGQAAAVVLITSVVDRSLKKYGDRGYRYVLMEAGHVAQNLNLTACALELGSCNFGGFFDHDVADLVGLDVEEEVPLYGVALGRPAAEGRVATRGFAP